VIFSTFEEVAGKYIFEHYENNVDELEKMNKKNTDQTLISLFANIHGIGK
jgi:hypothetical protein